MKRSEVEKILIQKGYYVDKDGVVHNKDGVIISVNAYKNGYYKFTHRHNDKLLRVKVHRLVAYQKFGDKIYDEKIVVRHMDGNSLNNSHDNINIGTYSDNRMDIKPEIRKKLSKNASDKNKVLNESEIIELQKLYNEGFRMKYLMEKFSIKSKGAYSNYINKKLK